MAEIYTQFKVARAGGTSDNIHFYKEINDIVVGTTWNYDDALKCYKQTIPVLGLLETQNIELYAQTVSQETQPFAEDKFQEFRKIYEGYTKNNAIELRAIVPTTMEFTVAIKISF